MEISPANSRFLFFLFKRLRLSCLKCPRCTSHKIWKDGIRNTRNGDVQRCLCRRCGYRFSSFKQNRVPQLKVKEDVVFQSFKKVHSGPDFAQISVIHCDSTAEEALNDSFFPIREDVSSHRDHAKSTVGKNINDFASAIVNAKCTLGKEVKNLVKVEPLGEGLARATKDTKGRTVEFLWWMKKQGYAESTIISRASRLRRLQTKSRLA